MTSFGGSSVRQTDSESAAEHLRGGINNAGAVLRIGDTVRRPQTASSPISRAIAVHLERVGFERAQRYLGTDAQSRDVFTYVDGEVPLPPYPAWAHTAEALREVAALLRDFHQAMRDFDPAGVAWSDELADPDGGDHFCHNDVCPENVVFQGQRAVALLDFEFAAPGHVLWDVARTARMWGTVGPPGGRSEWSPSLDSIARLGIFARAYGVGPADSELLIGMVLAASAQGEAWVQQKVNAGEPAFVEMWNTYQLATRYRDEASWLEDNRQRMMAAVRLATEER